MAVHYSDQMDKIKNTASANYGKKVESNELHGRTRTASFTFTTPTAGVGINDTINLVRLPAGARIKKGHIAFEAMSTGAGAASVQIGISGALTKYLGTTSVDAIGTSPFADTIALNYNEKLTAETDIIATAVTEIWAAAKKLYGHINYTVD